MATSILGPQPWFARPFYRHEIFHIQEGPEPGIQPILGFPFPEDEKIIHKQALIRVDVPAMATRNRAERSTPTWDRVPA